MMFWIQFFAPWPIKVHFKKVKPESVCEIKYGKVLYESSIIEDTVKDLFVCLSRPLLIVKTLFSTSIG